MIGSVILSFLVATFATLLYVYTYGETMRRMDGQRVTLPPWDCIWVFIVYYVIAFIMCKDFVTPGGI